MNETLLQAPYVLSWNYTNSSSNLNENFEFFSTLIQSFDFHKTCVYCSSHKITDRLKEGKKALTRIPNMSNGC